MATLFFVCLDDDASTAGVTTTDGGGVHLEMRQAAEWCM
jgi:hypothetical protein